MQSKMPDCCAAANCKQSTDQSNISFFRFPLDPERCKQWVGNCRRPDLQAKTPEYLHRNYKLCSRHFDPSMIQKESELKTVLKDGAVPTIFDFMPNKDRAQYSNRKRTRQPVAEDPVDAKKAKDDAQTAVVSENVKEDSEKDTVTQSAMQDDEKEEDPASSKAKETLKVYFKETLAFTGFSIINSAAISATKSMGSGAVGQLDVDPICAEKIESKDVLKLGEDVIREEVRNSLRLARFFSIVLQDKTNIEGKDQIPVFVRSVTNDGFPQKHLMGFLPCDVDSDSLFIMLVSEIRNKWGLRMEHCRGFTYLTTGSLCQKLKELSCRILRDFPQVVLAPCDPYAFNLWLIRSLPVLSIQDVVDTVEEVAAILRQSATLQKKLQAKITAAYSHIKGEVDRIKEACQNNWEYSTDAFQTMLDILEPLLHSIGEMCTSSLSDVDTAIVEQLLKLKEKLKNFNFIVTLVVLKNTLCCVSILNPSLKGIISISSTLQYTISNALKLLSKHLQEIPIFHRKWFSDAVCRAKKLGVAVSLPSDTTTNGDAGAKPQLSPEDYYRETLSKMILQYLIDEVKRVLGTEMVRILRWLSLVPSYMADHNFSIRKDKVADANLNNLARPDSFYDELGCWEVKWRHASKRRILPTSVFATLKIPDIGFYPNVQSLLRVLGSIPCINAGTEVYGQHDMVLDRYHSYMKEVTAENRQCNLAFVYVNQDVHFNIDDMVQSYVENHPDILQLLQKDDTMEVHPAATENNANDASKEDLEEQREMTLDMELERQKPADCAGTDKEALKSALQAAVTAAYDSQSRQSQGGQEGEPEYVTKSEMNEVLKVCEDVVREGILSEVGNSFFSLFIDRAVRFGETDFLPLFLRFVDSFDVMRLELMGFVDANLDTEAMSERLFDIVTKEWCLNLKYCRGQAYLGSGEVSYKLKAFACKVQEKYPLAICTHCSCYSFNTWWSRSVPVPSVSRALDILEKIVLFFSSMPDLEKQLDHVLAVGLRESYEKLHELQGNFCSSWLEKHDTYDVFGQILEPLADCLERFQSSSPQRWSLVVSNQAKKLLQLIRDFDFIVAVVALKNVSSFTRELSAALQKDHFSAASQICQISGIVATLNRVKTNIKVFHQNWFDEACAFAQSLGVQIKVPDNVMVVRDNLLKPSGYYKDAVSLPLVDHLINSVKDYFSDDHKEALNLLSLVPCSVTMSYTFENLKTKPPLYVGDLPDPDNFFTELSCWKVKWKTKVVSPSIPDTIFQTLRLPLMQYFANINTLLKIMCVLPSTALEYSGEVKRHKMLQDYLRNTHPKDRSPCLSMLQVATNFNRDLDRMVAQCLKVTPKTLEGICLNKESKTLLRNSEVKVEVDNHKDEVEEMEVQQIFLQNKTQNEIFPECTEKKADVGRTSMKGAEEEMETQQVLETEIMEQQQGKPLDENGHVDQPADNLESCQKVFRVAARLSRTNCVLSDLPMEEHDTVIQELSTCNWDQGSIKYLSDEDILESIAKSIRETIIFEVQESPFFSIITDKVVTVDDKRHVPVFVRYVADCTPKVELLGFLPFDGVSDVDTLTKTLSDILSEEWGLQMNCCRGQSFMCMGAGSQSLRKLSLGILESYPLAVSTPSESCGLAYWLAVSLYNEPITKVLGVVEDLLLFFDQSPKLHIELSQTMEGLLNTPREALAEVPETCLSRWKKAEDFFDILVDMLDGVLSCLDSVSNNTNGSWSNSMSIHALILSTAIRETDFVIPLVILKNACAPLRNCSTVFRCGNPADIICELEKIPLIIESLSKMLENISAVHSTWFEEATRLAAKISGALSFPETVGCYESPEIGYKETVSIPVLSGLIEEMKFNFSECHLRALKVLSLLPTCNPLPILPEATDKLYTIYQSDLPEPDMVEEEINTWATVWREKYQDTSPPASISETLHHAEAKGHPNVTALLKLVAVLPSISMECDLMKTTLSSLRTFLRDEIACSGNKTNTVMLLMHCRMVHTLKEVIDRCMINDPESHGFLSQVKQLICNMRVDTDKGGVASEETAIDANYSGGVGEGQPNTSQCGFKDLSTSVDDTTLTPKDYTAETDASSDLEGTQTSISFTGQSIILDGSEESLPTVSPAGHATESQNVAKEPEAAVQIVTSESVTVPQVVTIELSAAVLGVNTEPVTGVAVQAVTTEPVKEPIESVMEETVLGFSREPEMEANVQRVTIEPVTTVASVTTELTAEEQVVTTELVTEVARQSVAERTPQSLTTYTDVKDVSMELTAAAQDITMEFVTETPCQSYTTESITEPADRNITTDSITAPHSSQHEPVHCIISEPATELAPIVTTDPVTEAQGVAVDFSAAPGVTAERVTELPAPDITMEPVTAKDVSGELVAAKAVNTQPVTEIAAQSVTTDSVTASKDVAMELTAAAQFVKMELVPEMALQDVATDPVTQIEIQSVTTNLVTAHKDVTMDFIAAAQGVTTEQVTQTTAEDINVEPVAAPMEPVAEPVAAPVEPVAEPVAEIVAAPMEPLAEPMEPVAANKDVMLEQTASHCAGAESVTPIQDKTNEHITTENDITAEPVTTVQDIPKDHVVIEHNVTVKPVTSPQDITKAHVMTEHDVFAETVTGPQIDSIRAAAVETEGVTDETIAVIRDETQEHRILSQDVSLKPIMEQRVTTDNMNAAQGVVVSPTAQQLRTQLAGARDVIMEPALEVMSVATEDRLEKDGTCVDPRLEQKDVTTEPVMAALGHSVESTKVCQDMAMEPTVSSMNATVAADITTKPAAVLQDVTMEPITAIVEDSTVSSVTVQHAVTTEQVTTESDAMELTETAQGLSEPIVTVQNVTTDSNVATADVIMEPFEKSQDVSESAAIIQDIVMEPVAEAQGVSAEPIAMAQNVSTEPVKEVQDVTMEPLAKIEDISMDATDVQNLSVDPTESQDKPTAAAEIQNVANQDLATAESGTSQSKICALGDFVNTSDANPADEDCLDQPIVVSQDEAGQAAPVDQHVVNQAPSQCATECPIAVPTEDISDKAEITPQDQSYAIAKDGTAHPKPDTETSGQDDLHQPSVVTHADTAPQKKVLSFYEIHAQETFCKELANSKYFSIIFEQQVEIQGHPYIPVGISYLDKHETLCEDILAFVPLDKDVTHFVDNTTRALSQKWGLNLALCQGQSLLSVGNTAAWMKAVASQLSQQYPQAVLTLNSSVSLNMWLARSSTVTEMADSFTLVEKVLHWFSDDAEKWSLLQNRIITQTQQDERRRCELQEKLNKNKWERSHDILEFTVEVLEAIMLCLNEIKEKNGEEERTDAVNFLCIFQKFEFILTVVIMKNILSLTKNISQSLQGEPLDVYQAVNSLPDLLSSLNDVTVNIDSHFETWFQEAVALASKLQISVDSTAEEPLIVHYREVVIKAVIDHFLSELTELFSNHVLSALRCMQIVPYVISKVEGCCKDTDLFKVYQDYLPEWSALQMELQKWKEKWLDTSAHQPHPTSVLDTLKVTDIKFFPNIEMLLRLLMVLPCCRREALVGEGKKNLREFQLQPQRSLPTLYPL